jgi:hypothetical protein
MNGFTDKLMRAVTHYNVNREQCALAVDALRDAALPASKIDLQSINLSEVTVAE